MADLIDEQLPEALRVSADDARAAIPYAPYSPSVLAEHAVMALGFYSQAPEQAEELKKRTWSVLTLERYFVWTRAMWTAAITQEGLRDGKEASYETLDPLDDPGEAAVGLLLHWLASLEVVIEGWQTVRLQDADIEERLALGGDPHLPDSMRYRLRRFRNAVFHFQASGSESEKFREFWNPDNSTATWAIGLERAFERYFRSLAQATRQDIKDMQRELEKENESQRYSH